MTKRRGSANGEKKQSSKKTGQTLQKREAMEVIEKKGTGRQRSAAG